MHIFRKSWSEREIAYIKLDFYLSVENFQANIFNLFKAYKFVVLGTQTCVNLLRIFLKK